ncbi:TPA: hypothetical protein ACR25I_002304, partial [Legionella pneumophila]
MTVLVTCIFLVIYGSWCLFQKHLLIVVLAISPFLEALIIRKLKVAKITFNKKDYLCISGSLCVNGSLAAVGEYYIVENAFDYDKKLQL